MNVITAASWVMAVQRARMRRAGAAQRIAGKSLPLNASVNRRISYAKP